MRYIASFVFVIGLFISLPQVTQAVSFTTNDFITTWDTTKSGTSSSTQITIPGTGAGYSYSIYWESLSSSTATGTIATSTSASKTISFPEAGQYKVAIKGTYPRIYFFNTGDKLKILTVEQWGSNAWTSMSASFYGCANLTVPATDAPNLSGVTSMAYMFALTSFNNPINHWNVSNVTNMSSLFRYTPFNQPINSWNVSNLVEASSLFHGTPFNYPLDNWDVRNVDRTVDMFKDATAFNQPLNNWNFTKNWYMAGMFRNATAFNQPLDNWNTASATTMYKMFDGATAFNQDLSSWNIENIVSSTTYWHNGLDGMFYNAGLSTANLDSTLTSWASQSLKSNVPFHLGLKTYSSTGATALETIRNTYNWTISEQYQAEYQEGEDYTITGTTTQSHVSHGSTTTAVEVIPDERCEFISWSDGNTTNPRTDTLTDNLTVSANVECRNPSTGTSAKGRADKLEALGNQAKAEAVKEKYLNTTPANPATTPTLETAIINIKTLTTNPVITNNPESRQQLISILQQLVQILRGMAGESNK